MFDEYAATPSAFTRWFTPDVESGETYLRGRWLFLRSLGAVFFSAFYSLWFQIHGLIGSKGVLPAVDYLAMARRAVGGKAYWLVPTLLWLSPTDLALTTIVVVGAVGSIALVLNVWPRLSIAISGVCFLSFVAAAQDFSSYQSDGMLLEAAFLSLFLAPRGLLPRLGATQPPIRAAVFLLRWEWFRIYFESGLVKLLSGEPQWRNLTAMDKYYENAPLPTGLAWFVQQWPHRFHAASAAATLIIELFVVWMMFVPWRSARVTCFAITSALQIGIILTGNYAFLNYLVLVLGVLLLDDGVLGLRIEFAPSLRRRPSIIAAVVLTSHFLTTSIMFLIPAFPMAVMLEPARIVNNFGLFAVMTRARYEIEFQGTRDGRTWIAYPFRYKPQDVRKRPGFFAPYQPRFEWNLWFASLGNAAEYPWVLNTEARLLQRSPAVLELFARDPFDGQAPVAVRAVQWQYWFTTREQRRRTGAWWRRGMVGLYAPVAKRTASGGIVFAE